MLSVGVETSLVFPEFSVLISLTFRTNSYDILKDEDCQIESD